MELVTIEEIADMLGLAVRTVRNKTVHKAGFPAPVIAPSPRHRKWSRAEVIAWATPAARRSAQASRGSTPPAVAEGLGAH